MNTKAELLREIQELEAQIKPKRDALYKIYNEESKRIKSKIEHAYLLTDKFSPEELRFSATSRCKCGAGLAYPDDIGIWGAWHCSAILMGIAKLGESDLKHTEPLIFQAYEIKSEDQPSANGQTTRPQENV